MFFLFPFFSLSQKERDKKRSRFGHACLGKHSLNNKSSKVLRRIFSKCYSSDHEKSAYALSHGLMRCYTVCDINELYGLPNELHVRVLYVP